jgi:RhoGAP domain
VPCSLGSPHAGDFLHYSESESVYNEASSLLKQFIRELPDPLMNFALYNDWIQVQKDYLLSKDGEQQLKSIRRLLRKLPMPNYYTLKSLILFLAEVAQHGATNMMSARNIAIVFGPNLLRPEVETMESTLSQPVVNDVVRTMITKCERLFDGTAAEDEDEDQEESEHRTEVDSEGEHINSPGESTVGAAAEEREASTSTKPASLGKSSGKKRRNNKEGRKHRNTTKEQVPAAAAATGPSEDSLKVHEERLRALLEAKAAVPLEVSGGDSGVTWTKKYNF